MSADKTRKSPSQLSVGGKTSKSRLSTRQSRGRKTNTGKIEETLNIRTCARVISRIGEDVTPRPLADQQGRKSIFVSQFAGDSSSHLLPGKSSDYLMMQGSALPGSISILGASLGKSSALSTSRSFFDDFHEQKSDASFNRDKKMPEEMHVEPITKAMLNTPVEMLLKETELFWLVDISSNSVSSTWEEAEQVKQSNETYNEVLKDRPGNERFITKGMATIVYPKKTKGVQTSQSSRVNKMVAASWSNIYDTMGPFLDEPMDDEKMRAELSLILEKNLKTTDDAGSPAAASEPVHDSNEPNEPFTRQEESTEAGEGDTASVLMEQEEQDPASKVKGDSKIFLSESFRKNLVYMERALNLNIHQRNLVAYRGLKQIYEDPSVEIERKTSEKADAFDFGPSIKRLWGYRCSLTRGHNVSCFTFNKENPDLLAVGYCQFEYSKQKPGMVCCWSVKNCEFPEVFYHTDVGVTSIAFGNEQYCLLAVGLRDGVIVIYNVATSSKEPVLDTLYSVSTRHIGPVWDLDWITRDSDIKSVDNTSGEMLMSISFDGHVKQWAIRQGFKCKEMLKLKHVEGKLRTEKKAKRKPEIETSKYDSGLCFDFSPFDSNA